MVNFVVVVKIAQDMLNFYLFFDYVQLSVVQLSLFISLLCWAQNSYLCTQHYADVHIILLAVAVRV